MEQLELLEIELKLLQENIIRVKKFEKSFKKGDWTPCNSNVVGELKHRCISLKQRLTLVCELTTNKLLSKK